MKTEMFLRLIVAVLGSMVLTGSAVASADLNPGPSKPAGLPKDARDVAPLLAGIIQKHDMPGMVAAKIIGDRMIAAGAAGVRKRGGDERVTILDQFHIGSCTKSMTATLCGMLVEERKLSWETTIADVFPELRERMDPAYRKVTLRELLTHRGGAPADLNEGGLWERLWHESPAVHARQVLLEGVVTRPPEAQPGTKFIYSNAGYAIAGHMAEHVAGKPWEKLIEQRLFQPLGMRSAGFGAPGVAAKVNEPWGHRADGTPVEPGPGADNPAAIGPAGTVHCTIIDWAKYIALHLRGEQGDARLLKPETFKVLHTPPQGADYAMGWAIAQRPWGGGAVLTHAGSNTMWYAVVWMAPRKNFAVLVMCNQGGDTAAKACDDAAAGLIADGAGGDEKVTR